MRSPVEFRKHRAVFARPATGEIRVNQLLSDRVIAAGGASPVAALHLAQDMPSILHSSRLAIGAPRSGIYTTNHAVRIVAKLRLKLTSSVLVDQRIFATSARPHQRPRLRQLLRAMRNLPHSFRLGP
jgi:hypothetical protein